MGSVFRPLGVGIHRFRGCLLWINRGGFQPFPGLLVPPFKVGNAKRDLVEPVSPLQRARKGPRLVSKLSPFGANKAKLGRCLKHLTKTTERDRRPPAKLARLLPLFAGADGYRLKLFKPGSEGERSKP